MKTYATHQEILLLTGTTFSTREWAEKDSNRQYYLTEKERLENACWNGLLTEILPEIYSGIADDKKLFLWQIKEGNSFIELDLAEIPEETDRRFSIDPYSFMELQLLS